MIRQPFNSFLMGGFECSTHRDKRGRRLDLIASTRHDQFAEADYRRLVDLGMKTCRDGFRWHLIETTPGKYDFTSAAAQVEAAKRTGIQIIWDYFHYGYPDDVDLFADEFVERFRDYSYAATRFLVEHFGPRIVVCPINEISFFSWIAGSVAQFYPAKRGRGHELKAQMVKAAVASVDAIRSAAPKAVTVFTDPAIHVVSNSTSASSRSAAEKYRLAQFEAFDMLAGRTEPELGGHNNVIDVIGLNYYFHNQWFHGNRRKVPLGHRLYRPLSDILAEFYARYDKPMLIAETGIEDDERPTWFSYICSQIAESHAANVPVYGVCLYPIVNHPGWSDDRHCHNGLWDYCDENGHREIYEPLAAVISEQVERFANVAFVKERPE